MLIIQVLAQMPRLNLLRLKQKLILIYHIYLERVILSQVLKKEN